MGGHLENVKIEEPQTKDLVGLRSRRSPRKVELTRDRGSLFVYTIQKQNHFGVEVYGLYNTNDNDGFLFNGGFKSFNFGNIKRVLKHPR